MSQALFQQVMGSLRVRRAIAGLLCHQASHQGPHPCRDVWIDFLDVAGFLIGDLAKNCITVVPAKGWSSGGHEVQDAPQAEQVRARIDTSTSSLFRGHVLRRPCDDSRARDARIIDGTRQSKVRQHGSFDASIQKNVRWLHITVDQSLGMSCLQAASGLHANAKDFPQFERSPIADTLFQRHSAQILHHQIRNSLPLRHPVDR